MKLDIINPRQSQPNTKKQQKYLSDFITKSKTNGYFSILTSITQPNPSQRNTFEINYRRHATQHYKAKINKPFQLYDQPQYKRQLKFNSHFNAYIRSIPQFQRIQENINGNGKINIMPEMHSQMLVCDDHQRKCQVSLENVEKRRRKRSVNLGMGMGMGSTVGINMKGGKKIVEHTEQTQGIFTTKINIRDNHQNRVESRIDIAIDSAKRQNNNNNNHSRQLLSPNNNKKLNKDRSHLQNSFKYPRQKTMNSIKLLNSRRTNITISHTKSKQSSSPSIIHINKAVTLQNLNNLLGTEHKAKNFRITKQKLHELLTKRYGYEIITTFFSMQNTQNLQNIIKLCKLLLNSSNQLAQLITFLTYDLNQDGIITQDQLIGLNNLINIQNYVTNDINKIIQYTNNTKNIQNNQNSNQVEPDLPIQFIKMPTHKQYLKIIDQNNQNQVASSVRGIYRFFSFKQDQDKDDDKNNVKGAQLHGNLPNIYYNRKNNNQSNNSISSNKRKVIRINFEQFQKIFQQTGHPHFIKDVVQYLLGKQYNKAQNNSGRRASISISTMKKMRRNTTVLLELRDKQRQRQIERAMMEKQEHKIQKAQQILTKMYRDTKRLTTVQFD